MKEVFEIFRREVVLVGDVLSRAEAEMAERQWRPCGEVSKGTNVAVIAIGTRVSSWAARLISDRKGWNRASPQINIERQ